MGDVTKKAFEGTARAVGNEDYQFGDVAKAVAGGVDAVVDSLDVDAVVDTATTAASTTIAAGAAAKQALDDSGYQFGDISKGIAKKMTGSVEQTVRDATGSEDYKFGDITKSMA